MRKVVIVSFKEISGADLYCPKCKERLGKAKECLKTEKCGTCGKTNIKNPEGYHPKEDKVIKHPLEEPRYCRVDAPGGYIEFTCDRDRYDFWNEILPVIKKYDKLFEKKAKEIWPHTNPYKKDRKKL